ncbi:MAG: hypothetical protein JWO25_3018 [Alphaproteobacteria bacterium]|nr:hypothetical protein [Alphaproteobacteria bacterium]
MVQMKRSRRRFLAAAIFMAATPAQADLTARYMNPRGLVGMSVEVDEKGNMRVTQGNQLAVLTIGGVSYLLTSDLSGTYAVRQDDWVAVNAKRFRGAVAAMSPKMGNPALPDDGPKFDIVAGKTETVGGRLGTTWSLRTHGTTSPTGFDFVINTDPDLAAVGRAIAAQMGGSAAGLAAMRGTVSDFAAKIQTIFEKGTVIKMSGLLQLESVKKGPIPKSEFELPPVVLTRDQFEARTDGAAH